MNNKIKHIMKKILTYLSILTVGLLTATNSAEARTYSHGYNIAYVSGYQHCGTPIYTKKIFTHYDRYGKAIFKYHRVAAPQARRHSPYKRNKVTHNSRSRSTRYVSNGRSSRHSNRRY